MELGCINYTIYIYIKKNPDFTQSGKKKITFIDRLCYRFGEILLQ